MMKSVTKRSFQRAAVAVTAVTVAASAAVQAAAPSMTEMAKLVECRAIADDAARLVCLDREVTLLAAKVSAGSVAIVSRSAELAKRQAHFGLPGPEADLFKDKNGASTASVTGTVRTAAMDAYGKWVLVLADGSRWHQVDDYSLSSTPLTGQQIIITRAAIGTYKLAVDKQAPIRVRRES